MVMILLGELYLNNNRLIMKLLILLMIFSFVTGCKNSKITSNKEKQVEKDSLLNIKEQITEDTFMSRAVIHKMIEEDELLNKYRRIPEDSLLLTKIHYKDTIPNYIIGLQKTPKDSILYFRFLSVRLNRLKNKLLANYLRNRGNDLATVRNSAFCVAILSNNSFICKYNIFFRKYELSVAIL